MSVVEPGKRAWKKIRKEFGEAVFHGDGTLNRPALGQIVFSDPDKRHTLNCITHPEIYKSILFRCIKLLFYGRYFFYNLLSMIFEIVIFAIKNKLNKNEEQKIYIFLPCLTKYFC